jgi:hypothetical protein
LRPVEIFGGGGEIAEKTADLGALALLREAADLAQAPADAAVRFAARARLGGG